MNLRAFKKAGFKKSAIAKALNADPHGRNPFDDYEDDEDRPDAGNYHNWATGNVWCGAVNELLRTDPKARVYGIELELPCDGELRKKDAAELDKTCAIRKSDGSLRDYDIEFNFPPLTAKYIKRAKLIDHIGSVMYKYEYDEYDEDDDDDDRTEYGVHIHSNRGWMNENAALFVVHFIRNNTLLGRWISGRDGYSAYGSTSDPYSRYAACFTFKNTIEYRLFRSTTDQREVNVWLDFITAVEDWAHTLTGLPSMDVNSWGSQYMPRYDAVPEGEAEFLAYVASNKRKYGTLARALAVYAKDKAAHVAKYGVGVVNRWDNYSKTSLYACLHSILPKKRERKVPSNAQSSTPLPVAA